MRETQVWKFKNCMITHIVGSDSYLVFINGVFTTVYRSLIGAKKYLAKKLRVNYSDLVGVMYVEMH